jgi:hypothetical protein
MGHESTLDQFKSYAYLAAFLSFCAGKNNPEIDPAKCKPWIPKSPINFPKPAYRMKDIESFNLNEISELLSYSIKNENKGLGYIVFRLFSLCRYDELERFIALGGCEWENNPFIDLPNNRITFNSQVYLKRSAGQDRGRTITIHPTFRAWINWCIKNKISFCYERKGEEEARRNAVPLKFGIPLTFYA